METENTTEGCKLSDMSDEELRLYSKQNPMSLDEGLTKSIENLEVLFSNRLQKINEAVNGLLAIGQGIEPDKASKKYESKDGIGLDSCQQLCSADSLHNILKGCTDSEEIRTELGNAMKGEIYGDDESILALFETLCGKKLPDCVVSLCVYFFQRGKKRVSFLRYMFDSIIKLGVGRFTEEEYAVLFAKKIVECWDEGFYDVYIEYLSQKLSAIVENWDLRKEMLETRIEMLETAEKCRQRFPMLEAGDYGEARMWLQIPNEDSWQKAEKILRIIIFEKRLPSDVNRKPDYVKCPRCCKLFLKNLEKWSTPNIELRIRACEKGLRDSGGNDAYFLDYLQLLKTEEKNKGVNH